MKNYQLNSEMKNWLIVLVSLLIVVTFSYNSSGQEKPPRPVGLYLRNAKNLEFGAFAVSPGGAGGTVTVSPGGGRSFTGDLININLGYSYSPALFEIEGNAGTLVQFANEQSGGYPMTGSHGGTIYIHFYNFGVDSSTGNPFIITTTSPSRMIFQVGGTLVVGNTGANPPGDYSGTFSITVVQQ